MDEKRIEYIRAKRFPLGICDAVVLVLAVVLTVVLLCTLYGEKGDGVEIVYGTERMVLPLSVDTRQRVGDCLTVTVKDGVCYVSESDCKNQTCVKTGKIGRIGETIVCAQNKVVITVIGYDGLVGSVGQG